MTETAPAADRPTGGDIVARASTSYRVKWCVMGVAMLAYGGWSLYDGYVKWPRDNQQAIADATAQGKPVPEKLSHDDLGILLNKLIGIGLQPLGLFVLFWAFYSSRGEVRLSGGDTLHAPGHPPVSLDGIRAIDRSKWDRKGIAYIEYDAGGRQGRIKLDDYVYERDPVDAIHDRILAAVAPDEAQASPVADA